ncbi:MAG: twin transmembrane helix small protein [Alphaproteobacteria bacterium]|jgi:ABC-type nickel/cobalt efflux system permease component RcnA
MNGFLAFLIPAAIVATAIVLIIGLVGFARGGEFNRKNANKLMRLRILFQAGAIILVCIGIYASRN